MAWTSMHFAVGMCGGAAIMAVPCLIRRRGWRYLPIAMTVGGLWALTPDMPRLWREDFPSLPFAATLGDKDFEVWLHSVGDLFFMHRSLDAQPNEYALLGLAMIIGLYNLCLLGWLWSSKESSAGLAGSSDHAGVAETATRNISNLTRPDPGESVSTESTSIDAREPRPVIGRIGTG